MTELYYTDTVKCMLGANSNCVMNGRLRVGPQCAKCGFNKRVYENRKSRIRSGEMKENENGSLYLKV